MNCGPHKWIHVRELEFSVDRTPSAGEDRVYFFSSRRRHTRSDRDWSSECALPICGTCVVQPSQRIRWVNMPEPDPALLSGKLLRSEERRVGKECRSRWSPYH